MPYTGKPFQLDRFAGLNLHASTEIATFQASVFHNLYIGNEGNEIYRRKGTIPISAALSPASTEIDYLQWLKVSTSTADFNIAVHNSNVLDLFREGPFFGTAYLITSGDARLRAGVDTNGALINDLLVMGNGYDQNVATDGRYVHQIMPNTPTSGMAASHRTGPFSFNGTYFWKIAFISYDGYSTPPSPASPASGVAVAEFVTNASGFTLSLIPLAPSGQDCIGREIYRSNTGSGGTYYLVGTINDNTTTTFTDTLLDSQIDTSLELDTTSLRFPPSQVFAYHQGRLAGILCFTSEGDTRTLYLSNFEQFPLCPDIPPLDQVDNPSFGGKIVLPDVPVSLASFGGVLLVFFRGMIYRLTGDNPNNWSFDHWIDHGCVSHRTTKATQNILIWLGPDGVYSAEGYAQGMSVKRISDPIKPAIDNLSAATMGMAHAQIWDEKYFLFLPKSGSSSGQTFVYDIKYRTWHERAGQVFRHSTVSQNTGSRKATLYGTVYKAPRLFELETGNTDGASSGAITATWTSKDLDFGRAGRFNRLQRIQVLFYTSSTSSVANTSGTVKIYKSTGELIQTTNFDLTDLLVSGGNQVQLDKRVTPKARDRFFRIEIQTSSGVSDFRVLKVSGLFTEVT